MSVIINGTTGITSPGGDVSAVDNTVSGLTVGKGGGSDSSTTAVGSGVLAVNATGGGFNSAFAYQALKSNTSGVYNTALGAQALQANTTASNNTAVGFQSMYSNTTGRNTAFGNASLYANTTGTSNTAIGDNALNAATTANNNTAIGYISMANAAVTGSDNTAVGYGSLLNNTSGASNIAIGSYALRFNTTASTCTAVGYRAGYSNTASDSNTFIGQYAGYSTTGGGNCFVGGGSPTASGYYVTTGTKNTILGGYNGNQGGLDIRTASNYIVLSDGDGNPRLISNGSGTWYAGNASPIGNNSAGFMFQQNGELHLANASGSEMECLSSSGIHLYFYTYNGSTRSSAGNISSNGGTTSYNGTSDYRLKENIAPLTGALATVSQLKPVTFTWKGDNRNDNGFIAHELQEVLPNAVTGEKDAVNSEGNPIYQGIDPRNIVATLTAAIQELKAEFDAYKASHP